MKLRVGTVERGGEIRKSLEPAKPGTFSAAQVRATLRLRRGPTGSDERGLVRASRALSCRESQSGL